MLTNLGINTPPGGGFKVVRKLGTQGYVCLMLAFTESFASKVGWITRPSMGFFHIILAKRTIPLYTISLP